MEAICMKQSRKTLPSTSARYWPLDLCMSGKKASLRRLWSMLRARSMQSTHMMPQHQQYQHGFHNVMKTHSMQSTHSVTCIRKV